MKKGGEMIDDFDELEFQEDVEAKIVVLKKEEIVECPCCGEIVKYQFEFVIDFVDNSVYIPVKCPHCGEEFKIYYPYKIRR